MLVSQPLPLGVSLHQPSPIALNNFQHVSHVTTDFNSHCGTTTLKEHFDKTHWLAQLGDQLLLKIISPVIAELIALLLELPLELTAITNDWIRGNVRAIRKKCSEHHVSNCGPASLTSVLYQII